MEKYLKLIMAAIALAVLPVAAGAEEETEKTEPVDYATLAQRFAEEGGVHGGGRDWMFANWLSARSDRYATFGDWLSAWLEQNQKYLDSFISDDWTEYNKLEGEAKDKFLREMYFIGDFRNLDGEKFDALVKEGKMPANARCFLASLGVDVMLPLFAGTDAKGFCAAVVQDGFKLDGVKLRPESQVEFMARSGDLARIRDLPLDWFNLEDYRIKGGELPANWAVDNYYLNAMCDIWGAMLSENLENAPEVCRQIFAVRAAMLIKGVSDEGAAYRRMNKTYILAQQILKSN